jgi:hypothetical protein
MIFRIDNYLSSGQLEDIRTLLTSLERDRVYSFESLQDAGARYEILDCYVGMSDIHPNAVLSVVAMNISFSLSDLNHFDCWFEAARDRLLSEVDRLLAICERAEPSAELNRGSLRKKAR